MQNSLRHFRQIHYNVKYFNPIFVELVKEIDIENEIEYHSEKFNTIDSICLKDISFKYPKNKNFILEGINLELKSNTSFGFYGESGGGKTTLLDIISGLVNADKGFITINGQEINSTFLKRKLQNNISYTSQKTSLINDTLKKNICFGIEDDKIDINEYEKSIKLAELHEFEKNFQNRSEKMSDFGKNLSGGQIQRIGIARALYRNKDILIFDEATNALDENLEKRIIENIIKLKNKKIIIFISHNLDLMKKLDVVYEVKNKKILLKQDFT